MINLNTIYLENPPQKLLVSRRNKAA